MSSTSPVPASPIVDEDSLPCSVIHIKVEGFNARVGGLPAAIITVLGFTPFATPQGIPMPNPIPTIDVQPDGKVRITGSSPVKIIFNIEDESYDFAGAYWKTNADGTSQPTPQGGAACDTFTTVYFDRTKHVLFPCTEPQPGGSYIAIVDHVEKGGSYNYSLLVQNATDGSLGLYDPGMDNDPPA